MVRKIKGGLLVDIGVSVFLPASQVDIRRPNDIGDYIGRVVQCEVLKIDDARRNIVVSRRSLIEKQREEDREHLMAELDVGQIRKGIVKNIADFGAFVDLGGIDGLLHITDMSWERIGHPTEMVAIDQEIEVKILQIDREKQKIALGLKQKLNNPWTNIAEKYPVGSVVPGEVVNVMSYGAFVKLEPGIEAWCTSAKCLGLVVSTIQNEMVQIGDKIDVKILGVDAQGQQLSLGIKQTQSNPWDVVLEKYPENAEVEGKVRNLTNYGAFIELEEGIDGLLHVSDMSWTRKISHPSEVLSKGQSVKCRVLSVDQSRRRIALGLKQLDDDPWNTSIPEKYQPGTLVKGKVTKITTLVSLSPWKIRSKDCSTFPNCRITKWKIQKTSSRLVMRSRLKFFALTATSERSGYPVSESIGRTSKCEPKLRKKPANQLLRHDPTSQLLSSRVDWVARGHSSLLQPLSNQLVGNNN